MDERSLGQIAFEAYGDSVGWEAYDGTAIPEWKVVRPHIKRAWEAAAKAAVRAQKLREMSTVFDMAHLYGAFN